MRRYLLDTGPAFDFLFDRNGVAERVIELLTQGAKVGICTPVLGEIAAGLENSKSREASWQVTRQRLKHLTIWPYQHDDAIEFGRLAATLIRRGRPMQQIDIMIAAIAKTLGNCTVVSYDSDLAAIPGLNVENWKS